jgi:predicted nuclease of predicted toxin-antitoxin system
MRLYVDDDTVEHQLLKLLEEAHHDCWRPPSAGRRESVKDHVHLALAIRDGRVFVTKNYLDFAELHDLIMAAEGHHPGILIIRKDNDQREMKPRQIVGAIANLVQSGFETVDQLVVLNNYR